MNFGFDNKLLEQFVDKYSEFDSDSALVENLGSIKN